MRIETFTDLASLPPRPPFLIDGVLPERALTMIYGASGCGKTFIAVDMAHAIATGQPWLGRSVKPGRGLYVAAEGAEGFPGRVQAWHQGRGKPSLERMRYIRHPLAVHERAVREQLCGLLQQDDFRPDLIVIDTASANGPTGFDDNKSEHWKAIFDATLELMRELRCSAVFIHHPGHSGDRLRGSYDQIARSDVIVRVEKSGRFGARLKLDKARDFGWDGWIEIALRKVHCTDGCNDDSMTLVPTLRGAPPVALTPAQRVVLEALAKETKPMRASEWMTVSGRAHRTFYAAKSQLVERELVAERNDVFVCTDAGHAALGDSLAGDECSSGASQCNDTLTRSHARSATALRLLKDGGGTAALSGSDFKGAKPLILGGEGVL